jgi:predicted hydrocarbon binding protein
MTQEEMQIFLPDLFIGSFWQAAAQEMSVYSLNMILVKAGLEKLIEGEKDLPKTVQVSVFEFGLFQHALREYYGRGARGLLIRAGRGTWEILAKNLPWQKAIQSHLIPYLPLSYKSRLGLNQLRTLLCYPESLTQVTKQGQDLYYTDCSGLGISELTAGEPVCWTMLGLIQGALESVTKRAFEVEEVSCRGSGSEACKFRIHFVA